MRICMIGSGAMGSVYGGLIADAGYDVTLVDPRQDHIDVVRRNGLIVDGVRGRHVVKLPAVITHEGLPPCDVAIVFTDTNNTAAAAREAGEVLKPDGFALTLQNGIGNVEVLVEALGAARVTAGVTMNSGAFPEPGRASYTNAGMTSLGELDGRITPRVQTLAKMLNDAGIETTVVDNPISHIWSKFVHNCAANAIAAITGLRGGEIRRTPEVSALQDRVLDEVLEVVRRKGIVLVDPDPRKKIKHHSRIRYNMPSMMQHVEQGRRTEIDSLNGAIVREARALGMAAPYNEAVVAMVKGLEKSRMQRLHEAPRDYKKLEDEAEEEVRRERGE